VTVVSAPSGAGLVERILDLRLDLPPVDRPGLVYLLASEPRTGSNLLCALLEQTGRAGRPLEYFHLGALGPAMAGRGTADVDAYLADLMRRRTTPNGVFGMKMHFEQMEGFLRQSRAGLPAGTRLIRLVRRDAVAQAVSLDLARRSGRWFGGADPGAGGPAPAYDFAQIRSSLAAVLRERRAWTEFLARHGGPAPMVAYESLAEDPAGVCRAVMQRLGIAGGPAPPLDAGMPRKQGDARNAEWAARFRAEAAGQGLKLP